MIICPKFGNKQKEEGHPYCIAGKDNEVLCNIASKLFLASFILEEKTP